MKRLFVLFLLVAVGAFFLLQNVVFAKPQTVDPCLSENLKAASIYVKKIFYSWASLVKEYGEVDLAAIPCSQEANSKFLESWVDEDEGCFGMNSDEDVSFLIESEIVRIVGGIIYGEESTEDDDLDMTNEYAREFVSQVLKAAGRHAFSLLKAQSQRLSQRQYEEKINKSSERFEKKWGKEFEKALRNGGLSNVGLSVQSNWSGGLSAEGCSEIVEALVGCLTSGNCYFIIASSGDENGTIAPSGRVLVKGGDQPEFILTPNNGYAVQDVVVDSLSQGPLELFEFEPVCENHWITAYFGLEVENNAPSASFFSTRWRLTCTFHACSEDPEGDEVQYDWNFGDGTNGSGQTVSHSYATAGSYKVTLTVTDEHGASATVTQQITVFPW